MRFPLQRDSYIIKVTYEAIPIIKPLHLALKLLHKIKGYTIK